jgi:small-conductance mechanosensitive channel
VLTLGIMLGLKTLRVDLTGLAVVAGILSVGIGFGLQNVAPATSSRASLLIERPITVGDHVVVGDTDGVVRAIDMRSTEIVTRDNISVIVPNSEFVSGRSSTGRMATRGCACESRSACPTARTWRR